MRQAVREFAVVGQQDQALGVDVEAADVEQALVAAADVVPEVGAVRVVHRGDHADRLVEGEVDDALGGGDAHAEGIVHFPGSNKPVGVVSAIDDPDRPNLGFCVRGRSERLFRIGRLDVDTEA